MAQLIVRRLEEGVKRRLAARAKSHGHSMEEEARLILREAVNDKPGNKKALKGTHLAYARFANVPADFKIEEIRGKPRFAKFDE